MHYAPAGGYGFNCFRDELRAHLDSGKKLEVPPPSPAFGDAKWFRTEYGKPMPRKHSDIRKVTCRICWNKIQFMAREFLKR